MSYFKKVLQNDDEAVIVTFPDIYSDKNFKKENLKGVFDEYMKIGKSKGHSLSHMNFKRFLSDYERTLEALETIKRDFVYEILDNIHEKRANNDHFSRYHYRSPKIKIYFSEMVSVVQRRNKVDTLEFNLFKTDYGHLCYRTTKRRGLYVSKLNLGKVVKIELYANDSKKILEEEKEKKEKNWKKIQRALYDEKTWSNLKKENMSGKFKYRYINKIFSYRMKDIKKAFENKEEFRFFIPGTRRDYSVSGKMGEDGVYRAWFSSEYAGCGNGSYYLLLNPKLAIFIEND